jgi:ABC-type cobalamin/Fe3+-siderophores transport system ATPase subunit
MRIPAFEVRNNRSIRLARNDRVPELMIVAGPNGCGKSTLLHALRTIQGKERVIYVGPHRSTRRQRVMERHLFAQPISLAELFMRPDTPAYEGIHLLGGTRDAWGYDDTPNYLKHALCQVEIERQQAIAKRYDRNGHIPPDSLVDVWKPLRDLTHNLLPHLIFHGIDTTNRDQVRCLWRVHSSETLVDFDDLSSGEKSIVQMFYPLIERTLKGLLSEMRAATPPAAPGEICVLIDEPELHLHPNLQYKVVDYLRLLTSGGSTQVILATHSPTIVEYASFEELFLLRPVELVPSNDNQLVQVATNEDRLKLLRDVFGTTSNLTAMQPVVVVEGVAEKEARNVVPDRKLYRALHAGFDGVTIIPGGGKAQCLALIEALHDILSTFSNQLMALALLDRNTAHDTPAPAVQYLPVSMIENFLLDPDSIWEAIQSVVERTAFRSVDDVAGRLDEVLTDLEPAEVERRALKALGTFYFRPPAPLQEVPTKATEFVGTIQAACSETAVEAARQSAERAVNELRVQNRRREEFHGKNLVDEFYRRFLHSSGLPKVVFTFETARHARRRRAVTKFFDDFFHRLWERLDAYEQSSSTGTT